MSKAPVEYFDTDFINKIVKEVIYGEWIGRHDFGGYDDYRCSVCGMYEEGTRNPNLLGKYCSYCGATMRNASVKESI